MWRSRRRKAKAWQDRTGSVGEKLSYLAAMRGKIEMLAHLRRAKGCKWDELTCAAAAEGGHLEVLKYAHENGCPWNEATHRRR